MSGELARLSRPQRRRLTATLRKALKRADKGSIVVGDRDISKTERLVDFILKWDLHRNQAFTSRLSPEVLRLLNRIETIDEELRALRADAEAPAADVKQIPSTNPEAE